MRYQRHAIIIITALGSTHEAEALLGCSAVRRSFSLKLRPTYIFPRINHSTTTCSTVALQSSQEGNNENRDGGSTGNTNINSEEEQTKQSRSKYILSDNTKFGDIEEAGLYWNAAAPVTKNVASLESTTSSSNITSSSMESNAVIRSDDATNPEDKSEASESEPYSSSTSPPSTRYDLGLGKNTPIEYVRQTKDNDPKLWRTSTKEGQFLSRACVVYDSTGNNDASNGYVDVDGDAQNRTVDLGMKQNDDASKDQIANMTSEQAGAIGISDITTIEKDDLKYEDIDQSIPLSVYDPENGVDLIWSLLRTEAKIEAQREPLLVSFLYSTILNHPNLESALAFHLASRLASTSMDSIQVMNIILEALEKSPTFGRDLRADIIAVRDRDPACAALPDVFLHFKGFHALQSYRVANYLWNSGRKTLAHYFQSQMSQNFQIDIHPKATLKNGIMIDHGTGVVIGETAVVGYNCSILHHVTLGGSGKRGVIRHPNIGDGALLGAGATILGNVHVGKGCQVGAGTLVIDDLPDHSVAVGVPAKIIGTYKEQEAQPARTMNQVGSKESDMTIIPFMI